MKIFCKNLIGFVLIIVFMLGFAPLNVAQAATTPYIGATATYGVVSSTYTGNVAATDISGDVCYTTGPGTFAPIITNGSLFVPCTNGGDQTSALANINAQVVTSCNSLGAGAVNLDNAPGHGTGVYTPGCYTSGGAMNITTGATVTLSGAGTYIFKPGGALTTEANTFVTLAAGASACDVFWAPTGATTIGAYTTGGIPPVVPTFVGTIFRGDAEGLSITLGHFANLLGRALAFGSTVTTDDNVITRPTGCTATSAPVVGTNNNTITVFKQIINDNGGTAVTTDFPLFINGSPVTSGQSVALTAGTYTVSETNRPGYTRTFTGNCNANGVINHGGVNTHNDICTVVNNDVGPAVPVVPPLIDVVKTASPLSLPSGPGMVTYTYTLRNIGTVPETNITMVGDTCSPIVLASGDTNVDQKLDLNETWSYTCSKMTPATHTNTVVATGWANGISVADIASATVVVGASIVPPLIHVVKVPSPLTLPIGPGIVTYNYTVTNPGTVALSNVNITDDKCTGLPGRVLGHPGDLNKNDLLESNEAWSFTCKTNLTQTTTNTVVAYGSANGLTATDFALATVVVAPIPKLPKTGFPSQENNIALIVISSLFAMVVYTVVTNLKKQKTQ